MIKSILGHAYLFKSLFHAMRRKPSKARAAFDRAIQFANDLPDKEEFVRAYDARLLIMEDRHDEAREKLRSSIDALQTASDDDAKYVKLYCGFFLALYAERENYLDLKHEALKLSPSGYVQKVLPLQASENNSDGAKERSSTAPFLEQAQLAKVNRVQASIDF